MTREEITNALREIKEYFGICLDNAAKGSEAKAVFQMYVDTLDNVLQMIGGMKA